MTRSHFTFVLLVATVVAMHGPTLALRPRDAVIFAACLLTALALRLPWAIYSELLIGLIAVIALTQVLRGSIGRMVGQFAYSVRHPS